MKLLENTSAWRQWTGEELGRFNGLKVDEPKAYPCFGYMELDSWREETLRPKYLYRATIDNMSLELMAAERLR